MTPHLRPATPADAPRIADLLIGVRHAFMPYAPSPRPEPEVRAWIRDQLVATTGVTVAVAHGDVLFELAAPQASAARVPR